MWSDRDIKREQGWSLVIHPYAPECVTPVGYDIRVGFAHPLRDSGVGKGDLASPGDSLAIAPGQLALIQTLEFVWLAPSVGAVCHIKGSLGTKGLLLLNPSTVDPNWRGDLVFVVKNEGHHRLLLEYGMPIITLVFHTFQTPTPAAPKTRVKAVTEYYKAAGDQGLAAAVHSFDEGRYALSQEFDAMVDHARRLSYIRPLRGLIALVQWLVGTTRGRIAGFVTLLVLAIITGIVTGLAEGWYRQLFGH